MVIPVRFLRLSAIALAFVFAGWQLSEAARRPQKQITSEQASPTYYRDVVPILQKHCEACHRPEGIAPMAFESYEQTRPYAEAIRIATQNKTMPPWFADPAVGRFSNDSSLKADEISMLAKWSAEGTPAGNRSDALAPVRRARRWTIPEPDEVITMPNAVALPASGDVEYTYEIVPAKFKEDRWVSAAELLPEMRANVHHAVVYVRPPDSKWMEHAPVGVAFTASTLTNEEDRRGSHWTDSDILLVYAPGSSPGEFPPGTAKLIPAGSDLVFQMHYTTNGHAGMDRSSVGLRFAKVAPERRVLTLQLTNDHFVIPPGAPDYRVEARGTLPNNATLLSFFPHMHLRGSRFEYNIIEPGGRIAPLLRVRYHFHWQMSYVLATPLGLQGGTQLQAVGWFNNSKSNPHNPDPDAAVRWGEQTYDEMMVGFFDVAVPAGIDKQKYFVREPAPAK